MVDQIITHTHTHIHSLDFCNAAHFLSEEKLIDLQNFSLIMIRKNKLTILSAAGSFSGLNSFVTEVPIVNELIEICRDGRI